jgi:hypothetical protein
VTLPPPTDWHPLFAILPRRCTNGRWSVGWIEKRFRFEPTRDGARGIEEFQDPNHIREETRPMKTAALFAVLFALVTTSSTASAQLTLPAGASGHYDATLTFFQMENSDVDALLPPELERAPKSIPGSSHKHPVAILHQRYIDVAQPGGPSNPGWNERTLYIVDLQLKAGSPCIAHFGKQGPFAHLPIMHVDSGQGQVHRQQFLRAEPAPRHLRRRPRRPLQCHRHRARRPADPDRRVLGRGAPQQRRRR